jgi:hypothetical protein
MRGKGARSPGRPAVPPAARPPSRLATPPEGTTRRYSVFAFVAFAAGAAGTAASGW